MAGVRLPGCVWLLECWIFPFFSITYHKDFNKTKPLEISPSTKQQSSKSPAFSHVNYFENRLELFLFIACWNNFHNLFSTKIWLKFIPCQSIWLYQIRRKLGFIQPYLGFLSLSPIPPFHCCSTEKLTQPFSQCESQVGNNRKTSVTRKGISL